MSTETAPAPVAGEPKLSPVEGLKEASRWLRGTLADELAQETDHFSEEAKQLLKFHGSYQQEDRDARKNRAKAGVGKHYMCMIRLKLPGGKLSATQYLAMDELADKYANGTLRLTTRQSIQFHGILKKNLKATIAEMNDALVSTLGACGDVNRNVMACPAPTGDAIRVEQQRLADEIAMHLAPRSHAYHDIWLNGTKMSADADQADGVEPIYGKVYLPRKFKVALGIPNDNCVDILTQDLGFLAHIENGKTVGYNVIVGGGMGRTVGKPETFPHLGQPIFYVEPDDVVAASEAVIKFYRDHGNRADRKRARVKYVVHDWGVERVRATIAASYWAKPMQLPKPYAITGIDLHLGWHEQADGKLFLGISIENGRIKDDGAARYRTGIREIVRKFKPNVRISGQQDLLLCDIATGDRAAIEGMLISHGMRPLQSLSVVRSLSMACPAIPTCGLALTESERTLPSMIDDFEKSLAALGMEQERISVRMTGCPNGCARPYQSEIGLVGRSGEKYTLFLGGDTLGNRLNFMFQDLVPRGEVVPLVSKILTRFKADRVGRESFGDYCHRQGVEGLCAITGVEPPKAGH